MAGDATIADDAAMVENCVSKAFGVMTGAAIVAGTRVRRRRCLGGCVNTGTRIVAGFTGLQACLDQAMVEDAAHVETHDTMTNIAVDRRYRVAGWLANRRDAVTGIAGDAGSNYRGAAVIGIGPEETRCCMTESAFGGGHRMGTGRRVVEGWRFTPRYDAIVATGASAGNARVIETTVRLKRQKARGIMTFVAFGIGLWMKFGLADSQHAVVASATIVKHFQVIDLGSDRPAHWGMAGLAHIAGGNVTAGLAGNRNKIVVVAVQAA